MLLIRSTAVAYVLVFSVAPTVGAQNATDGSTQRLISQLTQKDEQVVIAAVAALVKQGPQVVPALIEALDKRKECQMQFVASAVLRRIEPAHDRIETTLARMERNECSGGSQQDFVMKQDAAFALSYSVSGLSLLVEMVTHRDLRTRRRVAFAFEDLTEKLDSSIEEFRAPAVLVEPTAQALPKLAPFLLDRDEILRCVTLEAMEQASASSHEAISAAGTAALAGKQVNCSR